MKQSNPIEITLRFYGAGNKTMKKGLPHTKKNGAGFTLMEVIVAIFIITTGIVGVFALVTQTISSVQISRDKLIAAYLAQEGIEIVRNIRDTNWLSGLAWDMDLVNCQPSSPCQADYDSEKPYGYIGDPLNLETAAGFYGYKIGTPTKFTRKITISSGPIPGDSLNVKVEVFWQGIGAPQKVEVQEYLYNW